MIPTLGCLMSAADICRANGWKVGSILVGRHAKEATRIIIITAIGENLVLGRRLGYTREGTWCFAFRDWQKIA